jgi:hypothetical protein
LVYETTTTSYIPTTYNSKEEFSMIIDITHVDPYVLFRIKDDLDNKSRIQELLELVRKYVDNGQKYFAFGFSQNSFFYPSSISVVVQCSEMIKNADGFMSIIEKTADLEDMIESIDTDKFVKLFNNIDEMLFCVSPTLRKT